MESIDALAKAVNEYKGGLVLVSHDMRLISQVANEIWICDNKTITTYQGDILNFKMKMRAEMGIDDNNTTQQLRGDASVKQTGSTPKEKKEPPKPEPKLEVIKPVVPKVTSLQSSTPPITTPALAEPKRLDGSSPSTKADDATVTTASTTATYGSGGDSEVPEKKRYIPPHLRKKMSS
jgi:ABC-type glutathione transport system ATPase component